MQNNTTQIIRIMVALMLVFVGQQANAQTIIDFDGVPPFTDHPTYSEDGFTLTPNIGAVRINNAFSTGDNAAQPSFGFGQGIDSSFTFTNDSLSLFNALSINLLEATIFPDVYGVTMIGTKSDLSTVNQTFTLDGVAGAETFIFSADFTGLTSLKIAEDTSNPFFTDVVQIDDVEFSVGPVVASIAGTVREAGTLLPLSALVVAVKLPLPPSALEVALSLGGAYEFSGLEPGNWLVLALKTGYQMETQSAMLDPGEAENVNFVLNPTSRSTEIPAKYRDVIDAAKAQVNAAPSKPKPTQHKLTTTWGRMKARR